NRLSGELAAQRTEMLAEREHLNGVLESMVEGVLVTDEKGRILQTNAALQTMFGLARPPIGRTSLEALRNPGLEDILARASRNGERTSGSVRLSHPLERTLEVGVASLGGSAGPGVVAVFHDITRLNKLEALRRDFVANVSHEIRTPVTVIRGCAETLIGGAEDEGERRRFTEIIIRHADRLTDLVDDLLALSSLESTAPPIRPEVLGVAELLASVEEAFRLRAAERGIVLDLRAPQPAISLRGDRRLLEQVFSNLLDNALKHTERGGRVTLSAAPDGDAMVFHVADTGCGIPAADLDRVFERFFRVDRARSRKLGGTGLGLAIVKHIVLLHGGRITVRSRLGEGTEFLVRLPGADAASADPREMQGVPDSR
ncbi:MAG: PAS domain-containing protein, partial [Gemmatimonadetes bacterium]|nr:PAS domain-containing protein [Gemmatimonadota bacterium]